MSTLPNIRKPAELSEEMGKHAKSIAQSQITVCQLFAEAWSAYENEGWTNAEFRQFATSIFKLGIGPNPEGNLLLLSDDGRYKLKSTWQYMNTVGKHPMFMDEDILAVCRSSSITNLYELTTLWKAAAKRKNSKTDDLALAKSRVIKFLEQSPDPTREQIAEARNKLRSDNKNDPSPKNAQKGETSSTSATIADLVERGEEFDTILVAPTDEIWAEVEQSSRAYLDEKYGLPELRHQKTSINVVAKGQRATSAIKMAEAMGVANPQIFCILEKEPKDRVLSLSDLTVLVSSDTLKAPHKVGGKTSPNEIVREMLNGKGKTLQLFAKEEVEGWTTAPQ